MKIFDYTQEAKDGDYDPLDFEDVSLIWIHRIGPGVGSSAVEISKSFQDERAGKAGSYTGGNMPYTWVNTFDQIQQALPLDEKGAHGRRFGNTTGWGFAQLGDFNREPPSIDQWWRAVEFCAQLVPYLGDHSAKTLRILPDHLHGVKIVGHGEVPAAFGKESGKDQPDGVHACPGKFWGMDDFRQEVKAIMRNRAGAALVDMGLRFQHS